MALGKGTPAGKRTSETIRRLEGLRKDTTRVMSFRVTPREAELIEREAEQRGLKTAQFIKSIIIQATTEMM